MKNKVEKNIKKAREILENKGVCSGKLSDCKKCIFDGTNYYCHPIALLPAAKKYLKDNKC